MILSSGARRLFKHLQFLSGLEKGAIKFQRTLAALFRVCSRTIRRWLTELREAGLLAAIIRRGRTSARYELDEEMSTRMSTQEAENVHSKRSAPLVSENNNRVNAETAERKSAQMETGLATRRNHEEGMFEELMGLFLASGKALNAGDVAAARVQWVYLIAREGREHGLQALAAAEKQLRATESVQYMPLPANFLRARPWTRTAPPRTLAYEKPSKIADRLNKAWEILKAEGAA